MFYIPFWLQILLLNGWIPVLILVVFWLLQRGSQRTQRQQLDIVAQYLGGLLRRQKITRDEHHRLCQLLEEDYGHLNQDSPPGLDVPRPATPKQFAPPQPSILSNDGNPLASPGARRHSVQQLESKPCESNESFEPSNSAVPDAAKPGVPDAKKTGVADLDVVDAEVVEPAASDPVEPAVPLPARRPSNQDFPVSPDTQSTTPGQAKVPAPAPSKRRASSMPWEDPPDDQAPAPRISWSEFLQGFMQENNIRWGELLSGMLIVGSAVGLVISLRHELREAVPYFPALLFLLVTAAIHGAGAYTLKKWKLPGTSRGVLLIGLLLIPLNFFAAGVLMGQPDQASVTPTIYWSSLAMGTAVFAALTYASCSMLFRSPVHWLVAATMIGTSLWQLPLHHGLSESSSSLLVQVLALPLAVMFLMGIGGVLYSNRTSSMDDLASAEVPIMAWGLTSFAFVTTCSMLAVAQQNLQLTFTSLSSSLLPAFGIGWVLIGGWLHREAGSRGWQLIMGLAISLVGTAVMLSSFIAAWPSPLHTLAAAVVTSAASIGISRRIRLPWIFSAGIGQAAVGFVVVWHVVLEQFSLFATGQTDLSWPLLMGPRTAAGFTVFSAILGSIGYLWSTRTTTDPANSYRRQTFLASVFSAILSAAIALVAGTMAATEMELGTSAAVLLLNAILALTAGGIFERRGLLRFGAVLLLFGTLFAAQSQPEIRPTWELGGQPIPFRILVAGMFVACTLLPAVILGCLRQTLGISNGIANRLQLSAVELATASAVVSLGASMLALPLGDLNVGWFAVGLAAVSFSLGVLCWQNAERDVYVLLQLSVVATSMVTATAVWYEQDVDAVWHAPFHLALQLGVLSGLLFSANVVHGIRRQIPSATNAISTTCERTVATLLFALLLVLSILVCLPGVSAEFGGTWRDTRIGDWLVELLSERLLGIAWGLTLAASVCGFRAGDRRLHDSGILMLVTAGILLVAAQFEPSASTASAIRWLTTPALLVGLGIRLALKHKHGSKSTPADDERNVDHLGETYSREWLWLGIGLGSLPTLLLMIAALFYGSWGYQFAGPNDPWFFGRLIPEVNYGVPLLFGLAATLIAAWHERERWFARAGFVGLVALVGVCLFAGIFIPHVPNRAEWVIGYSYASAMILALFGWGWIMLERKLISEHQSLLQLPWLQALLATALGTALTPPLIALLLLLLPAVAWHDFVEPISRLSGWVAFTLSGLLIGDVFSRSAVGWRLPIVALQGFLLALLGLIATTAANIWPNDPGLTHNLLMFGFLVIAALWLTWQDLRFAWRTAPEWSQAAKQGDLTGTWMATALLGTLIASYQLTLEATAPAPWLLPALGLLLVLATWGVRTFASAFAYFGVLGILGAIFFLGTHRSMAGIDLSAGAWMNLSMAMIAIYATLVLVLEIGIRHGEQGRASLRDSFRLPPPTRWLLVIFSGLFVAADVLLGFMVTEGDAVPLAVSRRMLQAPWGSLALASVGLLTVASLWDPRQRGRLELLYVWGIAVICLLPTHWWVGGQLYVAVLLTVTAYHGLVSRLLRRLPELIRGAWKVRVVDAQPLLAHSVTRWSHVVLMATLFTTTLAVLPVLSFELRSDRVLAALVPVVAAFAWGSLVPLLEGGTQRRVACGAIFWFSLSCLLVSLADVPAGIWEPVWLRRLLRIVLVGAFLTALYGAVASRLLWMEPIWRQALVHMTKAMAAVAGASLLLLVLIEMGLKQAGLPLQLTDAEATVVAVALLVMIAGLIVAALAPGQLRLQVSDATREAYVYLAEGVAGLLGIHVLLAMSWIVHPDWRPFWPYGLLALAFAGVGASEVCRRRGLDILSRPLLRTGTLLPVAPILLMWLLPAESDYAMVLICGGLLYFVMAAMQSRPLHAAAGAVCGNVALWTVLQRNESFEFFRHPQIWLIPPAVSLLLAIQLAPRALSHAQKSLLRYLCILVIYISSTSEIFIAGLGDALWPPMVLIVLSLLGVAFGIALQVRPFLVLGSVFIFISLVSMVMHAQRSLDHVWPWWAFGIGLGIGILTILGFFEKKRPELLAMLDRLRQWEG